MCEGNRKKGAGVVFCNGGCLLQGEENTSTHSGETRPKMGMATSARIRRWRGVEDGLGNRHGDVMTMDEASSAVGDQYHALHYPTGFPLSVLARTDSMAVPITPARRE